MAELVGNDLVDLEEPHIADHHLRARFLERVYTPDERYRVAASREPKFLVWALFAAKEAAFKVAVKQFGPVPFVYRAFEVDGELGHVGYRGRRWPLRIIGAGTRWVHAVVCTTPRVASCRVGNAGNSPAGAAARRLLLDLVAAEWGYQADALQVTRKSAPERWDGLEPPQLFLKGQPTAIDVSLSHDGRFVAAAALMREGYAGVPRAASDER